MSRFLVGNLYLVASMVSATAAHVLVKAVLDDARRDAEGWGVLRALLDPSRLVRGAVGGTLLVAGFLFWMLSLTRLDLSYAYPIACSSVLLVTLFSAVFLGEPVTPRMWIATLLIAGGVALLMPSS